MAHPQVDGFELDRKGSTRPQVDDPQQEQWALSPSFNEDRAVCGLSIGQPWSRLTSRFHRGVTAPCN